MKCAGAFCKLVIEEDQGGSKPPLNVGSLALKAKSLQHEALFAYDKQGNRRRTTIYLAKEGYTLPLLHAPGG